MNEIQTLEVLTMKCEHGIEIEVIIEQESPPYWDDGITTYKADGTVDDEAYHSDKKYLRVTCPKCKVIEFRGY